LHGEGQGFDKLSPNGFLGGLLLRVDFYQLGGVPIGTVLGSIAGKLLADDQRLLVIAEEEALLARLDRLLWDQGPASFLPHGVAGGADDARQPILLSTTPDAPNLARNLAIADGVWREAALGFDRAFYLFDTDTLDAARLAWKLLSGREGVDRHYWAQVDGKWVEKA
jgi:DNA polymerase III subunit chi